QQYLTIWLALTDATLDNGCPRVAPGLHKYGTLEHYYVEPLGYECFTDPPGPRGEAPAPVRAGGAVVFSSLMPHLAGPNLTDEWRAAAERGATVERRAAITLVPGRGVGVLDAIVSLTNECVDSVEHRPDVRPALLFEDSINAIVAVMENEDFKAAMKRRGIED